MEGWHQWLNARRLRHLLATSCATSPAFFAQGAQPPKTRDIHLPIMTRHTSTVSSKTSASTQKPTARKRCILLAVLLLAAVAYAVKLLFAPTSSSDTPKAGGSPSSVLDAGIDADNDTDDEINSHGDPLDGKSNDSTLMRYADLLHCNSQWLSDGQFTLDRESSSPDDVDPSSGEPLLFVAASRGRHQLVQLLINHHADIHVTGGADGASCLHAAANAQSPETLAILLEAGLSPTATDRTSQQTALHHLVRVEGSWEPDSQLCRMIDMLLDRGLDINSGDSYGVTPLICAIVARNWSAARRLVARGADVTCWIKSGESCALNEAIFHDNIELVTLLIERGAQPAEQRQLGMNSLHLAAALGRVDIARLLLDRALVSADDKTIEGWTFLEVAREHGQPDFVAILQHLQ